MATQIPFYQGQDWSQLLTFYTDETRDTPLVFSLPIYEVRDPTTNALLARFTSVVDDPNAQGLITVGDGDGTLTLSMTAANSIAVPAGIYQMDIFAIVSESDTPILRRGNLTLQVVQRISERTDV